MRGPVIGAIAILVPGAVFGQQQGSKYPKQDNCFYTVGNESVQVPIGKTSVGASLRHMTTSIRCFVADLRSMKSTRISNAMMRVAIATRSVNRDADFHPNVGAT